MLVELPLANQAANAIWLTFFVFIGLFKFIIALSIVKVIHILENAYTTPFIVYYFYLIVLFRCVDTEVTVDLK